MSKKAHNRKDMSPAHAGLPEASAELLESVRQSGIDPERLSIIKLGQKASFLLKPPYAAWLWRLIIGLGLWNVSLSLRAGIAPITEFQLAIVQLVTGLIILQVACEALITATERLAARLQWNHYVAGTVAEILSTTPELVVIAFLVPVSPVLAFVITLITIYNNALVFSLYSFFLPKDRQGKFLMPTPITEAGTQILIGGGSMGLILGLVMLTLDSQSPGKNSFAPVDLIFISAVLLIIFMVYSYKLVTSYAKEEREVRENLGMSEADIEKRLDLVYEHVEVTPVPLIVSLLLMGMAGAVIGGEQISEFAQVMIEDLDINVILTAIILAGFAGMSEYVILWKSHKKKEYGIALANAFGGITQVMFLVLPFTLLSIAIFQLFGNQAHPELPLAFSMSNIFLLLFLFPTFYTLSSLLEEDHTLGILDTVIMSSIFLFLIVLLASYGAIEL